jgi:hypothetical protein
MVSGIGTARVMCAVPSDSKVAESCSAAGFDWAADCKPSATTAKRHNDLGFIETFVPE